MKIEAEENDEEEKGNENLEIIREKLQALTKE